MFVLTVIETFEQKCPNIKTLPAVIIFVITFVHSMLSYNIIMWEQFNKLKLVTYNPKKS